MSIPAASATCALGKSCAVITVIGSPLLCRLRSVPSVTFLRGVADGVPMGECELHRGWLCRVGLCCVRKAHGGRRVFKVDGRVPRRAEAHDLATVLLIG